MGVAAQAFGFEVEAAGVERIAAWAARSSDARTDAPQLSRELVPMVPSMRLVDERGFPFTFERED